MADAVAPVAPAVAVVPVAPAAPVIPTSPQAAPPAAEAVASPAAASPAVSAAPAASSDAAAAADLAALAAEMGATAPAVAAAASASVPSESAPTLLSEAGAEAPVSAEAPAAPIEPDAAAIALPTYEPFTLPEGVQIAEEQLGGFTKLLGEFELGDKSDPHVAVQQLGQKLLDYYIAEQRIAAARFETLQAETWNHVRDGWKQQFKSDPEIGGNRVDTTLKQAGAVIERYGAVNGKEREAALRMAFRVTGVGDHPEMIRFINWASGFTVERARPVAAVVPKPPVVQSRAARRYGTNSGA